MENSFELKYRALLIDAISSGDYKVNRTGVNSYSLFGSTIKHNLQDGFPIITGRKIFHKNFLHELIWFINGESNIKYLNDNKVYIWDSWADKNGDLGPVYGYQLRSFNGVYDQLTGLINNIKVDKLSRRHLVTLWNPLQLSEMRLPPCYFSFQFIVDSKNRINLNVFMRSCDLFIGLPYDFSLFATLVHIVAKEVNCIPGVLQFNITDAHIYENHISNVCKYMTLPIYNLPKLTFIGNINKLNINDFSILNYKSGPHIKSEIAI